MRTVELALNLVWAIIATASYALLFRHFATRGEGHAFGWRRIHCVIALTCALAIIFPVISLTDDLHEMQATLEEASPSCLIVKKCVARHSANPERTLHHVTLIHGSFATRALWVNFGSIAAPQTVRPSPGIFPSRLGRAPPLFAVS
jgi:hypothetical protein